MGEKYGREKMQTMHYADSSKERGSTLSFMTDREQTTLVRLELNADDLEYDRVVASGKIVKYSLGIFEDNSNDGQLNITIKNTATTDKGKSTGLNAEFSIGLVNCS